MAKRKEPTIFDDVAENNPIFLVDTSGSMYSRLGIVKQHLKEYLRKMAFDNKSGGFTSSDHSFIFYSLTDAI